MNLHTIKLIVPLVPFSVTESNEALFSQPLHVILSVLYSIPQSTYICTCKIDRINILGELRHRESGWDF